ncbi:MAG: penicillin acylase family protein, partial [Saprospiraceae bacterium]|nr:penicillin acylase family protein [Saprospiraceae bacterium]
MEALRLQKTEVLRPEAWRFIELLQTDTASIFFDHPATAQRETARQIVTEGFRQMSRQARSLKREALSWSAFKGFVLRHMALIDAFSRLDVPTSGTRTAPNAISKNHGPSFRMVVEMTRPVHAWGVYPGGQSGNPGSRFYDNLLESWATGQYFDLELMDKPESKPEHRQILTRQTFLPK